MDVINLLAITLKKNLKSRKPSGAHQKINKIKKTYFKTNKSCCYPKNEEERTKIILLLLLFFIFFFAF
jgi:hypothetical protein